MAEAVKLTLFLSHGLCFSLFSTFINWPSLFFYRSIRECKIRLLNRLGKGERVGGCFQTNPTERNSVGPHLT